MPLNINTDWTLGDLLQHPETGAKGTLVDIYPENKSTGWFIRWASGGVEVFVNADAEKMIRLRRFPENPSDDFYKQFHDPLRAFSNLPSLFNHYLIYPSNQVSETDYRRHAQKLASELSYHDSNLL